VRSSLLLLLASVAIAQIKPGGVEGTVVNALNGEAVERAHVSLRSEAKRYGAISTAEGKFSIAGVAPGTYRVATERAGFLAFAERVEIRSDMTMRQYKIELAPEGAIVGRVLDAEGQPVEGVRVSASWRTASGTGITNDAGEFRVDRLPAGKYRLKASIGRTVLPPEVRTDGTKETHLEDTWYPRVLTRAEAATVEVRAGGEVSGVEIRLVAATMLHVMGVASGAPAVGRVNILDVVDGAVGSVAMNGNKFTIWNAPRGKHYLMARAGALSSATEEIEVTGTDREGIELSLMAPFPVNGRIEWEGDPPEQRGVTFELTPPTAQRRSVKLKVQADGSFQAPTVEPDRYEISLTSADRSVFVSAAYLGANECRDRVVNVAHGTGGQQLVVRLSTKAAEISGVVRDPKGPAAGVTVELAEEGRRERVRRVESGKDGVYSFAGVAPGTYRIGIEDEEAQKIEVRERERLTRDLKAQ
jgi:hypothetical protein